MSLSLFPPRDVRQTPPPPRRMPSLPQLNSESGTLIDNSPTRLPRKPSHSRMNSAPERVPPLLAYQNSTSPVVNEDTPPPLPTTAFSKNFPRFESAKKRAKDVWLSRRNCKGSVDLDTMASVPEGFVDSPTIPGRPAIQQEKTSTFSPSDCPDVKESSPKEGSSKENSPSGDSSLSPFNDEKSDAKSLMPSALPPSPTTPWPSQEEEQRPEVPPKSAPLPRKNPISPARNPTSPARNPSKRNPEDRPKAYRARAGSSPCLRTRVRDVRGAEPVPILGEEEQKNGQITSAAQLPHGVRPAQAATKLAYADMKTLQHNARKESESFDILLPTDWSALSRELSQLDSRCRYLRDTRQSLRRGRKTLHTRILANLRAARSATFSHESLLKQQEALAELDAAIDDWESKLEDAEERRSQVKQKLLEHVAATLSVQNNVHLPVDPYIVTPPATPEKQRRHQAEKESITVYALLADIKQEIERTAFDITTR